MKNSKAFHVSLVSVLFLSFLLIGITVASAQTPNIQYLWETNANNTASAVILVGTPPTIGAYVGSVGMALNITSQNGNLYWGELAVTIPTIPDPIVVAAFVTGQITNKGQMEMTVVDQVTGDAIGIMKCVKNEKQLTKGVLQMFTGRTIAFALKRQ